MRFCTRVARARYRELHRSRETIALFLPLFPSDSPSLLLLLLLSISSLESLDLLLSAQQQQDDAISAQAKETLMSGFGLDSFVMQQEMYLFRTSRWILKMDHYWVSFVKHALAIWAIYAGKNSSRLTIFSSFIRILLQSGTGLLKGWYICYFWKRHITQTPNTAENFYI